MHLSLQEVSLHTLKLLRQKIQAHNAANEANQLHTKMDVGRDVFAMRTEHAEMQAAYLADRGELPEAAVKSLLTATEAVVVRRPIEGLTQEQRHQLLQGFYQAFDVTLREFGQEPTELQRMALAGRCPLSVTADGAVVIGLHISFSQGWAISVLKAALGFNDADYDSRQALFAALRKQVREHVRAQTEPFFTALFRIMESTIAG
jgi:hypothetical protein